MTESGATTKYPVGVVGHVKEGAEIRPDNVLMVDEKLTPASHTLITHVWYSNFTS